MRARDNPFSTDRVLRIRYRLSGESWESLLTRLAALDFRAAIVGPEGSGKTTLLEDLEPVLNHGGFTTVWLRLTREQPRFTPAQWRELSSPAASRPVFLFDGAEQLNRWAWWKFLRITRHARGVLITTHRPGRLPTLLECRTDAGLLAGIMGDLLATPKETQYAAAEKLFRKHGGNLRDALREMFDRCAEDDRETRPAGRAG